MPAAQSLQMIDGNVNDHDSLRYDKRQNAYPSMKRTKLHPDEMEWTILLYWLGLYEFTDSTDVILPTRNDRRDL